MSARWQTTAVYFDDIGGVPQVGLTPTAMCLRVSDGAVVTPPTVTELGLGFYRLDFATLPAFDFVVRVDGGAALGAVRYVTVGTANAVDISGTVS